MTHFRVVILLILGLCPSLTLLASAPPEPGLSDKKQVELSKDRPMGKLQAGKALVYVVRPAFVGTTIKTYFVCDDDFKGINKGKSYFFFHVDPGKHVFWSKAENVDALELDVKAGQTYFIKQKIQMGALRARVKLVVLSEFEGKAALAKCKRHSTPTDRGMEKGKEIAIKYKENTAEDLARRARKMED